MNKLLSILLIFTLTFLTSCKEDKPKLPIKSNVAVKHYICANNCENSGGDVEGVCATCNTPYTHNQAFHNDDLLKNGPIKVQSNTPLPNTNSNTSNAVPEPAQNAQGIYHYTCKNACYGGAGTPTNCSVCGETLEHNTAYHN